MLPLAHACWHIPTLGPPARRSRASGSTPGARQVPSTFKSHNMLISIMADMGASAGAPGCLGSVAGRARYAKVAVRSLDASPRENYKAPVRRGPPWLPPARVVWHGPLMGCASRCAGGSAGARASGSACKLRSAPSLSQPTLPPGQAQPRPRQHRQRTQQVLAGTPATRNPQRWSCRCPGTKHANAAQPTCRWPSRQQAGDPSSRRRQIGAPLRTLRQSAI